MERQLDYPVFDADNHMYEQPDAFTRYLPDEYKNVIIRAGQWPRQARHQERDHGVHPEPDIHSGGPTRCPGGVLQTREP